MAWLESKGKVFRIRFRFGGGKHLHALNTTNRREAEEALARFESHLRLIDRGIIDSPPETETDLGTYIMSGGKLVSRPSETVRPDVATLATLLDSYESSVQAGAKEGTTKKTETIHIAHLRRHLGLKRPLVEIKSKVLQDYVEARARERGLRGKRVSRETIQKELGTLSSIWNRWGLTQGMVGAPLVIKDLALPKGRSKPPFQTREQIEHQIARSRCSAAAQAEIWQGLFLTLEETEEFLDHVQRAGRPAYVYPMLVFAAHTGARRSEIRRSLTGDFDFSAKSVLIREKKKDHAKNETYRTVPMSPRLEATMRGWLENQSGVLTFCTSSGQAITDHYATKIILGATEGSKWSVLPGWHCLRHSFISNCVARGVDQRLIDHWVGHTTEAMRRRYSHLLPAASRTALQSVFGTGSTSLVEKR